ncbi:MAG: proline dehydrogenase family protein [Phycisphaerales bacterium]|nr:proline dehydrogenase family protein [Phycisphaerales bacterium]
MLPEFDNTEIAFLYRSDRELKQARFLFASMGSAALTKVGMALTKCALALHLPINGLIKSTIFKQFCGGESIEEASETAAMLSKYNIGVILDYGVEGKEGEAEFDKAVPEFLRAIEFASSQKNIPFISVKITGFSRFALLEKLHSGTPLSQIEQDEWARVKNRINTICAKAAEKNIKVLVDAEESWIQNPIDEITEEMMELYNKGGVIVYNTFQLYLHSRLSFLKASYNQAQVRNYFLGAKLVRGAYMEKERTRAVEMNYPSPVQPNKNSSDRDYDAAVDFCIERLDKLYLFIGTHNEKSCLLAAQKMQKKGIDFKHPHIYFSQLFGMSDNISFNLANHGFQVAKYLPYGPVKDVMPYLMRRAQENTSVAGQTGRELGLINKELGRRKLL